MFRAPFVLLSVLGLVPAALAANGELPLAYNSCLNAHLLLQPTNGAGVLFTSACAPFPLS
jgi:hypothetical protein